MTAHVDNKYNRLLLFQDRWSVVFRSYVCAGSAPLGTLFERAERSAGPMLNATLTQRAPHSCTACCDTRSERWSTGGLEAWRYLVLHHEPTSLTCSAGLLQELLHFSFAGETAARMEQLWPRHRPLRESERRAVPRNIRIGVALRMLPDGPLKQHLVLNSTRLTTWVILKAEIDNVRRAQAVYTPHLLVRAQTHFFLVRTSQCTTYSTLPMWAHRIGSR